MTECNKAKDFQYSAPTVATSTIIFERWLILGVVHKYLEARPENSLIFLPPSAVGNSTSNRIQPEQTVPNKPNLCILVRHFVLLLLNINTQTFFWTQIFTLYPICRKSKFESKILCFCRENLKPKKFVPILLSLHDAVATRIHRLVQKELVCYLSFDSSADTNVHSTLGQSSWRVKSHLKKWKRFSDKGFL